MTILAAVGQSRSPNGRDAGQRAAAQALEQLNRLAAGEHDLSSRPRPVFAWVIASHSFPLADALAGAMETLGNVQALGFSTSSELSAEGRQRRSVVVAILAGGDLQARAGWWGEYAQDPRATLDTAMRSLKPDASAGEIMLLIADGFNGDADMAARMLTQAGCMTAGCLSGGEVRRGRTYQAGGRSAGSGGLAAAALSGDVVIGQGAAHGWQPVGALARVTRVQDQWVRLLDDRPAAETYARLFGSPAHAWARLPLSELARVYPLGLPAPDGLELRSPLRFEADGSLRMNANLAEGQMVEIMIGSPGRCRQAAIQAAQQALRALGPTRPRLALLLVDTAWQSLLDINPMVEVEAVQAVLGAGVPICGGYTLGQLYRSNTNAPVRLLNGHIQVVLFGSREVETNDVVA